MSLPLAIPVGSLYSAFSLGSLFHPTAQSLSKRLEEKGKHGEHLLTRSPTSTSPVMTDRHRLPPPHVLSRVPLCLTPQRPKTGILLLRRPVRSSSTRQENHTSPPYPSTRPPTRLQVRPEVGKEREGPGLDSRLCKRRYRPKESE